MLSQTSRMDMRASLHNRKDIEKAETNGDKNGMEVHAKKSVSMIKSCIYYTVRDKSFNVKHSDMAHS